MMQALDKQGCAYETWHLIIYLGDLGRYEKFDKRRDIVYHELM